MRTFFRDLRYGLRVLRGSPGFTAVAVATLALGIAAGATVFTWIDSVLLRPIPAAASAHQLVVLETLRANGEVISTSYPDFRDYRDNLKLLSGLAVHRFANFRLGDDAAAQPTWGELVSGNYFAVLGVKPLLGRFFLSEEQGDKPGGYPVVVISERLWRNRFRADPGVVGSTILVNRNPLTIVGVAPPEFHGAMTAVAFDMWVPVMMQAQLNGGSDEGFFSGRGARLYWTIGRLKPGVTVEQARSEVAAQAGRLAATYPRADEGIGATLLPVWKAHTGAQGILLEPLQILMALSIVVLLIACANVANLMLARSIGRRSEFAIRLALGAGRGRLARQMLTESLMLAALAAVAAVPLALWMARSLFWLLPPVSLPIVTEVRLDWNILGFTVLISAGAAVLSGLIPVLHSVQPELSETLKEGGRGGSAAAGSHRTRSLLVIAEIALALVALIGAALFTASFRGARSISPGFDPHNVAVCRFYLSGAGYTDEQDKQFCLRLQQRIEASPGIESGICATMLPMGIGSGPWADIEVEGYTPGRGERLSSFYNQTSPGFFRLLRIPLLEGRDFTEQDDVKTMPVMIVNETFVRRFFAGVNPVGRRVRVSGRLVTIVGAVRDTKYFSLAEPPMPYFYLPFRQTHHGGLDHSIAFYARSSANSNHGLTALRREVAAIDPGVGMFEAAPLSEYMVSSLFPQKLAATLLSVLGAISLLLAALGVYSVMAYAVMQRTHEIGIRMALGAETGQVLGLVIRRGMTLTAAGLVAGIIAALAAARLVASMLTNVSATDPMIFAGAAVFLAAVALAANYLPARRAAKVDPVVALRHQ